MTKLSQAILVSVWLPDVSETDHRASMMEMGRLAHTLGFDIVARVTQKRHVLAPSAVLGEGKLRILAKLTGGKGVVPSGAKRKVTRAQARLRPDGDDSDNEAQDGSGSGRKDEGDPRLEDRAGDDDEHAVDVEDHDHDGDDADAPGGGEAQLEDLGSGGDYVLHGVDRLDGDVDTVIVDHEISPSQIRNLEKATGAQVFDRPGVIIEIFHRHARTREARLQVELARLAYEAPRLREKPSRGDRQRGGVLGGAGESALELDRRRIRDRMAQVRQELEAVGQEQSARRARRRQQSKVALVGYTNAGKSSLMRALTGSEVLVADQLFATLGPTVRTLVADTTARILVSDTVGFIKILPHDLVASFRSTLDEARDATLLLFVVDAAEPDFRAQLQVTREVIADIGVEPEGERLVLNKCDCLTPEAIAHLRREFPDAVVQSTREPERVDAMRRDLVTFFERDWQQETFDIPYTAQTLVRELHLTTRVLSETYDGDGACLRVRGAPLALERIREQLAIRRA